jgi:hypothetical protein
MILKLVEAINVHTALYKSRVLTAESNSALKLLYKFQLISAGQQKSIHIKPMLK